ncbi:Leucine-rich repeat-containing protein 40 [Physocladia obscura]|uniref:Leucine-rich repeat-containing protein 40 n=1 Tax=Physocladia obscura TaxID=109957 RepID=A0AAD5SYH8_9FUNG|nr:Leucine-rich repeat-containing protein 40 [Physocladia obscura]
MLRTNPTGARNRSAGTNSRASKNSGSADTATSTVISQAVLKIISSARSSGRLNLSNQELYTLPVAMFDNSIQPTSGNWWEEVDLTKLIIADNNLETIDERVTEFGALTLIDMHNNKLSALPDLSSLQQLTVLNLSSNALTNLPDSLFSIPLAELRMTNNYLSSLPASIASLAPSLVVLDISDNQLQSVPPSLLTFPRLTTLSLKSNKLSTFTFDSLPSLTHLDISHNNIASLTGDPSKMPKLQQLNVSQNSLSALFSLSNIVPVARIISLPSLITLDVRINRITTLSVISTTKITISTPVLKDLLVQGNQLKTLEGSGILESSVKSIETLDFRDNGLEAIPAPVVEMELLKRLLVEGNPIRVPRRAIIEKGTAAIIAWMKDRIPIE